jgi:hypothetical protein
MYKKIAFGSILGMLILPLITSAAVTMPLTASKWTEGLSPSYIKFKNDSTGALYFDFPTGGKSVNYSYAASPSKTISGTLKVTFSIATTSGNPVFAPWPEAGNTCDVPANTRPFIFANKNDWSGEFSRWYATPDNVVIRPGSFTISVPLTGDRWTSVYGKSGTQAPTQFASALKNVSSLGVTFGGGCFYAHGVIMSGGTAKWVLTKYVVE